LARTAATDTRDRVLGTATRLFYEHGVRAIGMQRIIDETGCGKNLLYQEFPSKTDLVAAHLGLRRREQDEAMERALRDAGEDAEARMSALLRDIAANVEAPDYRGCPFRNYLAEFADHSDEPGRIALAYVRDSRVRVEELAGRIDPGGGDELAERLWLVVEGMYAAAAHPGGDRAAQAAVALAEDLVARARRR
jgi:AcrR family transcriptional regulator